MAFSYTKFQIGKNGVTPGVIEALSIIFKKHTQVRISLLKSSGRDRGSIEKIALEIVSLLEKSVEYKFSFRIIGFTIIMLRHPKP
jgi:RNA-binding protein YhbY